MDKLHLTQSTSLTHAEEPTRPHILILATFLLITNISIFCLIFSPVSSNTGYTTQFVLARTEQRLLSPQNISINTILINILLIVGVYKKKENFVLVWLLLLPPFHHQRLDFSLNI